MFRVARQFINLGVLSLNRRNANYILMYNPRHLYPLADNKLRTKKLAKSAGVAVPELYCVVETQSQISKLPMFLEQFSDFVIKPAHGKAGEGILVVSGRLKKMYRQSDGSLISQQDLKHHVSDILSGLYSLGGESDNALVEYCVKSDPIFEAISYGGVPDIRIIIFLGVPVMSMVRLPTRISRGKANLHQDAIGVGIDIATGTTLNGVWRNEIVSEHPDTGYSVYGVNIANWQTLLKLAVRCYELSSLGYQGVDIVLDKDKGPLILELNTRPGLNIQIANDCGLLPRLKLVEEHYKSLNNVEKKIAFAQKHFCAL
jgi:alpha-L-glutamate ligase-like protein